MVAFEFSKQRIFGPKIQIFIKDWIFALLSKIFLIRNPSPSATTCEASGGLFLIFYLKWFSWFWLYRNYKFPFGVRVKAYWCMQQVLLLHVWKALSTPTFGFDGSKDPKSDTQSLLSTFWPSLGLLVFYCPKASKSGFYLRLFLRWKHNFSCPKSLGRFPKYPEFKTWKELESLGARMCD